MLFLSTCDRFIALLMSEQSFSTSNMVNSTCLDAHKGNLELENRVRCYYLWPQGPQLLRDWACACAQLLSCVWFFATPWTVVHQAPVSMEFFRQEYTSGLPLPSPEYLPDSGIKPTSPALAGGFITTPSDNFILFAFNHQASFESLSKSSLITFTQRYTIFVPFLSVLMFQVSFRYNFSFVWRSFFQQFFQISSNGCKFSLVVLQLRMSLFHLHSWRVFFQGMELCVYNSFST